MINLLKLSNPTIEDSIHIN